MERILIYQDKAAIELWKEQRLSLNKNVMEFSLQLKENDFDLDQEIFEQFIKEGSGFIWGLLEKQVNDYATRTKLPKIAKANLLRGNDKKANEFKVIHEQIYKGLIACQIQAKDVTITQGKAILTKEELEKKRQELSIYIETPCQLELWNLLQNICNGLNSLEEFASKEKELRSIFVGGSPVNLTDYFYWVKDPLQGGMIFKPDPDIIQTLLKGINDVDKPE